MLDFIEHIGIGGVLKGNKMKLANTSGLDKAFFSNPEMTDTFMEIKGEDIKGFLAQFGKYTEDIKPDISHVYSYKNAHGAAQIADKTTQENLIKIVRLLKHPIKNLLEYNFFKNF